MNMNATIQLSSTDARDAYANLIDGARRRLTSAAWAAKGACEAISNVDGDPLEIITRARRCLDDCMTHAIALAAYQDELKKKVAK